MRDYLIYCPVCEHECSSAALECPGCGHPLAEAAPPAAQPVAPAPIVVQPVGRGCERCGSTKIKQVTHTPTYGYALFIVGVLGAPFTCGVSVILIIVALCVSEKRSHCRNCRYTWGGGGGGGSSFGGLAVVVLFGLAFAFYSIQSNSTSSVTSTGRTKDSSGHTRAARQREIQRDKQETKFQEALAKSAKSPSDPKAIIQAYDNNEVRADAMFKGKYLCVRGRISQIGKDILGSPYIAFDGPDNSFRVMQCMFDGDESKGLVNLESGKELTVCGKCSGLMMNVLLRKCQIVPKGASEDRGPAQQSEIQPKRRETIPEETIAKHTNPKAPVVVAEHRKRRRRRTGRSDFRKVRWGMTVEQVKEAERGSPYREPKGQLLYLDVGEMYGAPVSIAYSFTDGILTMAGLEFPNAQENMDAVRQAIKKIDEKATKEAGKPIKKDARGDTIVTVWQSERTRTVIMITVVGTTSMDVTVLYGSVKYGSLPALEP